ncbi:J domain-containing protein [Cytobacillus pseudoceanisediminis]|uniref:J domain-containing protein n=1 Tax=Bacillaceae TaxID=186817 RepID=UPI001A8D535C|nr:J domain-containing protein [Bacillus sp. NTK034]MBN8199188.1 J domain-containing protein [Bacillus sp. NTK034]
MKDIIDYYEILRVSYFATSEEIKEAYRRKVKDVHPDKVQGNDEDFKIVKEAYDVLSNEEKRRHFNDILFNATNFNVISKVSYKKEEPQENYSPQSNTSQTKSKTNKWKIFAMVSIGFCIVLISLGVWGFDYYESQIVEVGKENNTLIQRLSEAENDNSVLDSRLEDVTKENLKLTEENIELNTELSGVLDEQELKNSLDSNKSADEITSRYVEEYDDAFTQGSSKEHVKEIMGTPTQLMQRPLGGESWWYGETAWVNFDSNGRVEGWYDTGGVLKVK